MFSCHVLEHVPSPQIAFDLAKSVLKPGGLFVAFTPNGSDASRVSYPDNYNHSWGRLHPLYLNAEFYQQHFKSHSWLLTSANYGEPYKLDVLRSWHGNSQLLDDVSGRELLAIVRF